MRPRDPSNTQREIRDRRDELGYPELSTHAFRKTATTILDAADGLTRGAWGANESAGFMRDP